MSRKTQAIHSARQAARAAGGSHATIAARQSTMARVIQSAWNRGQQVSGIEGLKEKHIAAFLQEQKEKVIGDRVGVSDRTAQNHLAHIRTSLVAVGRDQASASAGISCTAFGVDKASREGTRAPATGEQVEMAHATAAALDPGLAATVSLQDTLGLRAMEAIRSGASLGTWARDIAAKGRVTVIFGTKGKRPREVRVIDREAALIAVREAQAVAAERGGTLFALNLKQAATLHRNSWHRAIGPASGITSHQLRAGWVQARVVRYQAQGYAVEEAYGLACADLGHGDQRGRWLVHVYLARA